MALLCKKIVLILSVMLFVLCTLLFVGFCVAPVTVPVNPKSGPEIASVVIHNTPVWKPPVIATNPYTGEVTDSKPGYWMQNGTVEITIRNHPFSPYIDENGNTINTYYCIFCKYADFDYMGSGVRGVPLAMYQSDSDYTVIVFKYGEPTATIDALGTFLYYAGDASFRIQTVEGGYFGRDSYSGDKIFEGVGSEWKEFTVTIPSDYKTPSNSKPNIKPTSIAPDPSNPNNLPTSDPANHPPQTHWTTNLLIIIATVCIITIPLLIVTYLNKQQQRKVQSINSSFVKNVYVGI